ncbi:Similar to S.cerevisiae protein CDA2 (Chitin deacetylase) [Malassezia sympodialis ATCC 42132]|uniref:chitin deacetylase n=1 Tax=Malassezia sympodialis (strain ATCC 42132) TaxID=1230383 RepID=A0A1M8AC21_MALS4|nr:Similar to S.cerevisiae protein CDA2 (Chitin deacetylase) [Malassezia sympodialis ATCC 42132]
MKATAVILALIFGGVSAHLLQNDSHHRQFTRRKLPAGEAAYESMTDPSQECKYYEAPEISQMNKNNLLPKVDKIANIVDGDKEANSVWSDIQSSGIIPGDVKVKADSSNGQHMGASSKQSNYKDSEDPDCWWTDSGCTKPKHKNIPQDIDTCPEPNTYGLTFDDGPNCTHNAFYDYLKEKKLKATMFYIGSNVATLPYQAQRAITDGHDVCVHTWSHRYMTTLSNEQVFAELFYTIRVIKAVLGVTPTCWRPPFGDVDDRVRAIAAGLGLTTIIWNQDSNDWDIQPYGSSSPSTISSNYDKIIKKGGQESVIVLSHELYNETMQMFINKQPEISQAFKNTVPISACYNITKPYLETGITYPNFNDFIAGNANYQGLPDGNSIKIDPNVKLNLSPVSKQSNGFANPGSSSGSSGSSGNQSNSADDTSGTSGGGGGVSGSGSSSNQPGPTSGDSSNDNRNAAVSTMVSIFSVCIPTLVAFVSCL